MQSFDCDWADPFKSKLVEEWNESTKNLLTYAWQPNGLWLQNVQDFEGVIVDCPSICRTIPKRKTGVLGDVRFGGEPEVLISELVNFVHKFQLNGKKVSLLIRSLSEEDIFTATSHIKIINSQEKALDHLPGFLVPIWEQCVFQAAQLYNFEIINLKDVADLHVLREINNMSVESNRPVVTDDWRSIFYSALVCNPLLSDEIVFNRERFLEHHKINKLDWLLLMTRSDKYERFLKIINEKCHTSNPQLDIDLSWPWERLWKIHLLKKFTFDFQFSHPYFYEHIIKNKDPAIAENREFGWHQAIFVYPTIENFNNKTKSRTILPFIKALACLKKVGIEKEICVVISTKGNYENIKVVADKPSETIEEILKDYLNIHSSEWDWILQQPEEMRIFLVAFIATLNMSSRLITVANMDVLLQCGVAATIFCKTKDKKPTTTDNKYIKLWMDIPLSDAESALDMLKLMQGRPNWNMNDGSFYMAFLQCLEVTDSILRKFNWPKCLIYAKIGILQMVNLQIDNRKILNDKSLTYYKLIKSDIDHFITEAGHKRKMIKLEFFTLR